MKSYLQLTAATAVILLAGCGDPAGYEPSMSVYTDQATGCQYVMWSDSTSRTPYLDKEGQPICGHTENDD